MSNTIGLTSSNEQQKITKGKTVLSSDYYKSPQTSLLMFHFDSYNFQSSNNRIKTCEVHHASIENKELFLFNKFFSKNEQNELRDFFGKASYSRSSYGTAESMEKGEKPAYSMNTKERWSLFSTPPQCVQEVHKLLSFLAHEINAEITTMPWELCHSSAGSPAINPSVIVNFHNEGISKDSMHYGMHQDCKPEKGVFFAIPVLYKGENSYYESCFVNGALGKPWLVSLMLYSTSEDFLPEYGMGTVFFNSAGERVLKVNCLDSRIVLFQGDIFHSPEESNIPQGKKIWRISYVLKLIINPKSEDQCLKKDFLNLLRSWHSDLKELELEL